MDSYIENSHTRSKVSGAGAGGVDKGGGALGACAPPPPIFWVTNTNIIPVPPPPPPQSDKIDCRLLEGIKVLFK